MNSKHAIFFVFVLFFNFSYGTVPKGLSQDTAQLVRLLTLAKYKLSLNQVDSAELFLREANKILNAPNKTFTSGYRFKYLTNSFDLFVRKKQYKDALLVSERMISFKGIKPIQLAQSYYAMAFCQSKLGELSEAVSNITKALKIVESIGKEKEMANYYFFLSDIFFQLRDGKKSKLYSTKAYNLLKTSNDSTLIDHHLDVILFEILNNELDLALRHLKEAEVNIDKLKNPVYAGKMYLYLSHIYYRKEQFEVSLSNLKAVLPYIPLIKDGVENQRMKLHTEMALAQTYEALKSYKLAKYYFEKNITHAIKEMDASDIRDCYQLGSRIFDGLGEHKNALSYLKKYTLVSDSVNSLAMKRAINDTEVKYQTTLKEKALSDQRLQLATKDNEIQKRNRYLLLTLGFVFLLILSALVIYLVYRNRNQSIELSLLKAQIHPHFLFNTLNNLYALSISKSDEAPGVVMGLSNILRYILYECNTINADLQKELEIITEYIKLEKIRYSDGLEVNTYFSKNLDGYTVAPLLLLPLVENAYKHGVNKLEGDSWINIEAKVIGEKFIFKISNNKPINKNKNTTRSIYGNIGLKNIKKRLEILYPKQHRFKIMDSEDIFMVTLELKVKES